LLAKFCDLTSNSSLPGLTRQSILFAKSLSNKSLSKMMDARIKSGHDGRVCGGRRSAGYL